MPHYNKQNCNTFEAGNFRITGLEFTIATDFMYYV